MNKCIDEEVEDQEVDEDRHSVAAESEDRHTQEEPSYTQI